MRSTLKRHLSTGCVAVATLALSSAVAFGDHCNSYRGPAGQVPPTGRTPSDPTPPAGGGGTTGGGGNGGLTGGFGGPGATTAGPGGVRGGVSRGMAPRGGKKGSGAEGFERWEFWWEYNKDPLLNLRSRLSGEVLAASGSADFFLGSSGAREKAHNVTRPTEKLVAEKVVPELIKALDDKNQLVRDAATIALGKIGDPSTLPHLVRMLKDENRDVQESAALSMGLLGNREALPMLVSLMNDDDNAHKATGRREILTRTRAFAAVGLGLLGDEQAVPELIKATEKNEAQKDVAVSATVALGILKSHDAVDRLIGLVKDENADEFLRAYAATSLGKIGDEKALPVLEDAVRDKNLHVQRSAVMALGLFGGEATERIVAKVKDVAEKGRDPQAKNWAMISLGRLGGNNAKKTLLAAVEGEQKSTQAFAALGLALLGLKDKDEVVVETLRKTLADTKDPSVQGAFAVALGLLEDTASEAALTEIVKSQGTADTRGYAAVGLGLMRARNATPAIEAIVKDTNEPTLQRSGAIALGLMADRNVVTVLSEMLKTANTVDVLSSTAQALGTIGDHMAIEPLLQCWRDTSGKMVDQTRAYALTGIGILCEPTDVPKMSWVSRDLNYRAQLDSIKTLLNLL